MGDVNAEILETNMASFCDLCKVNSLLKKPTRFKNSKNSSWIDIFQTNCLQ